MIVSVTTLGAADGDAVGAAGKVVQYLDGRSGARGGTNAGTVPALPPATGKDGVVAYYADSVEGPGRWLGRGMSGMRPQGEVDKEELRRVLLGQHVRTGVQLLGPTGSAARAEQAGRPDATPAVSRGSPDDLLTLGQAASLLGVSPRYLRRLATRTASARADGDDPALFARPYLDATQDGDGTHWKVTRAEVERFRAQRKPPAAVVGYDLTFSVPKSVSILWATASPDRREEIVAAVHQAVGAGMAYTEEHAAFVRSRGRRQRASGLVAASYLHATSRALDPQLHCHVVVANMAESADGEVRALDGRPLYAHAKTAGYLAAAELRHELTRRLGVAWEPAARGVADIVGVSDEAIREMSRRADDIAELTEVLGVDSALARQVAAYATRTAKEHAIDAGALRPAWRGRLEAVGFDQKAAAACYDRQAAPRLVTGEDRERLFGWLGSARGVTELASTFDRRDVLQKVAEWADDRLPAAEIADLADEWLAEEAVVTVHERQRVGRTADVIRLSQGGVISAVGGERLCTTRDVLAVEAAIDAAYVRGREAGAAVVPVDVVEAALAARAGLGEDQRKVVRSICESGYRIQCLLGPAGAGKTTALEAAVRAWEASGYSAIGAAVQGTAAEVLGSATGIPSSTVASLLVSLDVDCSPIGPNTVVVLDEASTLGNRDLARLAGHIERRGAALRLVGDPAQHSAVAAGGAWRRLTQQYPEDTPGLSELRRQAGPTMSEVRLALREYRQGQVAQALDRLRRDERIVEADNADDLLDAVVTDWYVDRQRRRANPQLPPSSMMADHHDERRELNRRARILLAADGTLTGPGIEINGVEFRVGDEVIARLTDRRLRPRGGQATGHVRNGERGRVVEVRREGAAERHSVVVDFERRGPVEVPYSYLIRRLRPGLVGGLAHSYALTTNAAQGETYEAARHLTTDRSSRPGVYVGLSRGRSDSRLYVIRKRQLQASGEEHPDMPRLEETTSTMEAVTARLRAQQAERLATEVDARAAEVARLRQAHTLAELEMLAQLEPPSAMSLYRRALMDERAALATAARLQPAAELVARLGSRPPAQPLRAIWDQAVGNVAVYRKRWGAGPLPEGPGASWAIGPEPSGRNAGDYRPVEASLHRAEVAAASTRPPANLLTERKELIGALAGSGLHEAADALVAVEQERAMRDAEFGRLRDRVEQTQSRARRRNEQALELARRDLDEAQTARAAADHRASLARDRVACIGGDSGSQARIAERLTTLEAALDMQAARNVDRHGLHLTALLGDRPVPRGLRSQWDRAAQLVQGYRVRYLGATSPPEAVSNGDALRAAIGPRPSDSEAALWHDRACEAIGDFHADDLLSRLASHAPVPAAPSTAEILALTRRPLWQLRPELAAARHAVSLDAMLRRREAEAQAELARARRELDRLRGERGGAPVRQRPDSARVLALREATASVPSAQARADAASAALRSAPEASEERVDALEEAIRLREDRLHARTLLEPPRWLRADVRRRVNTDASPHRQIDVQRLAGGYGRVAVFAEQARRAVPRDLDDVMLVPPDDPDLLRVWDDARRELALEPLPVSVAPQLDL